MMKIKYYFMKSSDSSMGVLKKIETSLVALAKKGHQVEGVSVQAQSLASAIGAARRLWRDDSDIVWLRSTGHLLIWMPALIKLRLRGAKIIIDVATPKIVQVHEILNQNQVSWFRKLLHLVSTFVLYPLVWMPANLILQHSYDGVWFYTGVRGKVMHTGNPAPCEAREEGLFHTAIERGEACFSFVAISHLKFWHGYDRLLVALYEYMAGSDPWLTVRIDLIGDGPEKCKLEKLAERLGINDMVNFHGVQDQAYIKSVCEQADIGVAAIGAYRKRLHYDSAIKVREYMSQGLPVVISTNDLDIPENCQFIYRISNSDAPFCIKDMIQWYQEKELYKKEKKENVISFFKRHLSAEAKIEQVLAHLSERK